MEHLIKFFRKFLLYSKNAGVFIKGLLINYTGGQRMNDEKTASLTLQWHPAFYAGIQIEFENEASELIFQNEYQLGTRPKEVDVLIIKKRSEYQVKKNIGRFFRKYNLIEYKPPGDSLNIDDFYKLCSYAGFYKANSNTVNERKVSDITITLVTYSYPREMIKIIEKEKRYNIQKIEKGIYYILGGMFPTQLIVTRLISEEQNFWLHNLTNKLKTSQKVYREYQNHKENELYKSIMNFIVKANKELFQKEENKMCQALYDLFEDKLMEMVDVKARELAEIKAQELADVKTKNNQNKIINNLINNLINNAHFTLEQALDILMISEEERKLYTIT